MKGEGENGRRLDLGEVWAHDDAKGFNVVLDTAPVGGFNGRRTLRSLSRRLDNKPAMDPAFHNAILTLSPCGNELARDFRA